MYLFDEFLIIYLFGLHIAKGMLSTKSLFKGMFRMGIYESQDMDGHI